MAKDPNARQTKRESAEVQTAVADEDHERLLEIGTTDDKLETTRDAALKGYIEIAKKGGTAAIPVLIELGRSGAKDEIRQAAGNAAIEVAVKEGAMQFLLQMTTDEKQLMTVRENAGKALATMYVRRNKTNELIELFRNPNVPRSVKEWMSKRSEDRMANLDRKREENRTRLEKERAEPTQTEGIKTFKVIRRSSREQAQPAPTQPARPNTVRSS